ncbi:MAG: hypothetical protein WB779_16295 [Ignavibacteriaceae bacterium]
MEIILSVIFAIAMGYLEAAVVVYLRELYYPEGFHIKEKVGFPFIKFGVVEELKPFPQKIILTEIGREAATIVMLITLSIIAGNSIVYYIAYFLLLFGIWDIFYYVFLRIILGWPESLSTTDVFFLIPTPWIGPVWLPVLLSVIIIAVGLIILL